MDSSYSRVAIVGAGISGLVALRELRDAGHDAFILEKTARLGGQWNSVYDSVHLLSAKSASQFAGFPMPESYPPFPSGAQFLAYIVDFAHRANLMEYIRFSSEVVRIEPVDDGMAGWYVTVAGQTPEHVDAVVVANGHLIHPRRPTGYPGAFTGRQLHTSEYRNASQFEGQSILVVGAGNSGCDMAIDAVNARKTVHFSVRTGTWFLPTTFFGRPRNELSFMAKLPAWLAKKVNMWMVLVSAGRPERYGLPTPVEDDFNKVPPTISTLLPYWIQRGRIRVVPEIERFDGKTVRFRNGEAIEVDTIIWATGYEVRMPFVPEGLLNWVDGVPGRLVGGLLSADVANLYFSGLASPRGGAPHNYGIGAATIVRLIEAQKQLPEPLATAVFGDEKASGRMDYLLSDWKELLAAAEHKVEKAVTRLVPTS